MKDDASFKITTSIISEKDEFQIQDDIQIPEKKRVKHYHLIVKQKKSLVQKTPRTSSLEKKR